MVVVPWEEADRLHARGKDGAQGDHSSVDTLRNRNALVRMEAELTGPERHLSLPESAAGFEDGTKAVEELLIRPAVRLGKPHGEPGNAVHFAESRAVQAGRTTSDRRRGFVVRHFARGRDGGVVQW